MHCWRTVPGRGLASVLFDHPGNEVEALLDERRVGLVQPAPWRDAVGDVDDFVGIETVKFGEGQLLEKVAMQR